MNLDMDHTWQRFGTVAVRIFGEGAFFPGVLVQNWTEDGDEEERDWNAAITWAFNMGYAPNLDVPPLNVTGTRLYALWVATGDESGESLYLDDGIDA